MTDGRPVRIRRLPARLALAALCAVLLLTGVRLSGDEGVAAATAPSEPARVPPTSVGINLFGLESYNRERVFANLVAQGRWRSASGGEWVDMGPEQLDARGWVTHLRPGQVAPLMLALPAEPFGQVAIRCTYEGRGRLSADGIARVAGAQPGRLDLMLSSTGQPDQVAWLTLEATDREDPLHNLDCREPSRPRDQLFDPGFVASLRPFAAVRFLDWQQTNGNRGGDWSRRTTAAHATQLGPDGAAVEHMVRLANEAGVDPWFLMPYNATPAYIESFARHVHAHLAPGRTAYVELGNEVWNDMFEASRQARREGVATGLAPASDPFRAQMRRYAEKSRAALAIWTRVFADEPKRLVRVVSTLNVVPDSAEMVLGFRDTARFVDALATAPYIHLDLGGRGKADLDRIFTALDGAVDETIAHAAANRTVAARHGKRYIAYEGGQHLLTNDVELARLIQRDPRMGRVYARYLRAWRAQVGDRIMLYASTTPIGHHGAWGLREYAGQPVEEAPKLKAVLEFIGPKG